jgi:hypothetical protein
MIRISPRAHPDSGLMDRITDFGRQVEARGFPGVWVGDSVGRGRPTLDSLQVLSSAGCRADLSGGPQPGAQISRGAPLGISGAQISRRPTASGPF